MTKNRPNQIERARGRLLQDRQDWGRMLQTAHNEPYGDYQTHEGEGES